MEGYIIFPKRSAKEIRKFIGEERCRIIGAPEKQVSYVAPLDQAKQDALTFCVKKGEDAFLPIKNTKAGIIICDPTTPDVDFLGKTLLLVDKPRLWFIRVFREFFTFPSPKGIHTTVVMERNVRLGKNVYIGAYTTMGNNVEIGDRTIIYGGVRIYDNVKIGKDVIVHSNCVIGADGFGYAENEKGEFEKFPHIGVVIIGDRVELGASVCIDRGTLSDTKIGDGTKINNLVHIAHNVQIGANCVIAAQAMISGGVKIGDNSWIAPCVCIRDGIEIGQKALLGMGAVVIRPVPMNDVVVGVPAKSIKNKKIIRREV